MNDRLGPIFVLGCGRSGTTLLRLMLNSHPRIAIPGETWFFPDLQRDRDQIRGWHESEWRDRLTKRISESAVFPELGVSQAVLRQHLQTVVRDDWPAVVACANAAFAAREEKARWGDKTPGFVRYLRLIKHLFPIAVVLHMIRHGRDVALSFLEQPFGPTGILEGADYWRRDVEQGRRDGRLLFGADYHEVRYEELVEDPARVLRDVCGAIGESYSPRMLEYHDSADRYLVQEHHWHERTKSAPTRARTERWRREMDAEAEALFELCAGTLLRELNYPLTHARSASASATWAKDRITKRWRSALLRVKIRAHALIHRK